MTDNTHAPPSLIQARQLWIKEQFVDALKLFDKTVAENPENLFALIDAARVHGQMCHQPQMELLIKQLLDTQAESSDLHLQVGMTYRMAYRPQSAIKHLKKAVKLNKQNVHALLELSILFERQGKIREASNSLDKCLKYAKNIPEALAVKARLLLRQKKHREAASLFKQIFDMPADAIYIRTQAYALTDYAKQQEKLGKHEEAFETLRQAKELLNPLSQPILQKQANITDGVKEFFEALQPQHLRQWSNAKLETEQQVCLMTSFPRSGTTLLESMLGCHPELIAADEFDVFNKSTLPVLTETIKAYPATEAPDAFSRISSDQLNGLQRNYLTCHANAQTEPIEGKILLDKNPSNTVFIPFYLRLFPNLKLLIPLRDPRDVILSCYFQYFPVNPFSVKLLELESAAKQFVHDMSQWISIREKLEDHQWLEVKYESLTNDPEPQIREVLDFLGLGWADDVLQFHSKKNAVIHNAPTYSDVQQEIYHHSKQRWRNYESHFTELRPILEPTMNQLGYQW